MLHYQDEAASHAAAELARYRWFLSRLEWFERLVDARPTPPEHRRPLSDYQAARLYRFLRAEYEPSGAKR